MATTRRTAVFDRLSGGEEVLVCRVIIAGAEETAFPAELRFFERGPLPTGAEGQEVRLNLDMDQSDAEKAKQKEKLKKFSSVRCGKRYAVERDSWKLYAMRLSSNEKGLVCLLVSTLNAGQVPEQISTGEAAAQPAPPPPSATEPMTGVSTATADVMAVDSATGPLQSGGVSATEVEGLGKRPREDGDEGEARRARGGGEPNPSAATFVPVGSTSTDELGSQQGGGLPQLPPPAGHLGPLHLQPPGEGTHLDLSSLKKGEAPLEYPLIEPVTRAGRHGTLGEPIMVLTNCARVRVPRTIFYQFDVHYVWLEMEGPKAIKPDLGKAVAAKLGSLFGERRAASDGKKIVVSTEPLPTAVSPEAQAQGWAIVVDPPAPTHAVLTLSEGHEVRLTFTVARDMSVFLDGIPELKRRRAFISILDILFRPTRMYKMVRGAFYHENVRANSELIKRLGSNPHHEAWLGYRQTLEDTTSGPMIFIDFAACAMYAPVMLLEFIAYKVGRNTQQLNFQIVKSVEKNLCKIGGKKPKIKSTHAQREYKLQALDDVPANESRFTDHNGREWTVAEYFESQYNKRLQRPDLPCVCVPRAGDSKGVRIPIELISLAGGQPITDGGGEVAAAMITVSAQAPAERFDTIWAVLRDADAMGGAGFDTEVARELIQLQARVLPSMALVYANQTRSEQAARNPNLHPLQREETVQIKANPHTGSWNLRTNRGGDVGFVKPGERVDNWLAINFAPGECDEQRARQFLQKLVQMARQRGMFLRDNFVLTTESPDPRTVEKRLDDAVRRQGGAVQLVVCFMPTKNDPLYWALKRWSETGSGIPLQCVKGFKVAGTGGSRPMGSEPSYHAGILQKVNLKLGGKNVYPSGAGPPGLDELMQKMATMVCGVDVNHAAPGSNKPSWAALVASLSKDLSQWHTIVTEQPRGRQEFLPNLKEHTTQCMRRFFEVNGEPPQRVIFYRDGVAHNMFEVVTSQEIGQISQAFAEQGLEGFELIFVVAQKKTNARFAMEGGLQPKDKDKDKGKGKGKGKDKGKGKGKGGGGGSRELGNVPPGTVVDTVITDRTGFDFYLVSQHALQGTAKPTHFHVLTCPPSLTADQIQQFTFDLCHVYERCTKIVSRPAPIYYAHLAAFHAPWYDPEFKERGGTWETSSNSSGGSGGSGASAYAPITPAQANKLYMA